MRTRSAGICSALFLFILSTPASGAEFTVLIKEFNYSPNSLSIKRGDSVKFVNEDSAPHTVTPYRDAHFKPVDKLGKGESATVKFENLGQQKYYCDIHPMMEGVVLVKE